MFNETFYTLESSVYGNDSRYKKNGAGEQFKSYKEAYSRMINLYDAENYNCDPHGYWFIKKHTKTEYIGEDGTIHRNEMIQPVWG